MTIEEIIEGNKLIAAFAGAIYEEAKPGWMRLKVWTIPDVGFFDDETLRYHSDWSWLMPVVEKIEKMDYGFKMCRKVVEVYIDSTKEVIIKTKESCRLESLFKAVVQFINYHNTNKK